MLFARRFPSRPALVLLVASSALPLAAQEIYPGARGEPASMDVECLCSSDTPPTGEYLLSNDVAYSMGQTIPTGEGDPTRIEVSDCGGTLHMSVRARNVTLTREALGETQVYRGPYETDDGVQGTITLVVAGYDGLPFEPAVRVTLRGEAEARGVHFPLVVQLKSVDPEAFEKCKCALMARYYEKIAQYRESFADASLRAEAERRHMNLEEYQGFVGETRHRRQEAFDRSLGRTDADAVPGGGGSTSLEGVIHIDDLDMLDRGVPPEMIESVHVHEETHQRRRQQGIELDGIEAFADDEVAASRAQLDYLRSWLGGNCPDWRPPTRVFDQGGSDERRPRPVTRDTGTSATPSPSSA